MREGLLDGSVHVGDGCGGGSGGGKGLPVVEDEVKVADAVVHGERVARERYGD